MGDSINIDCAAVEAEVSSIGAMLDSNGFEEEYVTLAANLSESEGEQAKAIKQLLKAEKTMIVAVNQALQQFLNNIQSSAQKLATMDKQEADEMYSHNNKKR